MSSDDVSPADPPAMAAPADSDSGGFEALACVSCRSRKLKCDRTKPACTRCARLKSECVYPESRRKPTFKRRNVKELEDRLAQVEVLLKDAAGKTAPSGTSVPGASLPDQGPSASEDRAQSRVQPDPGLHSSDIPSVPNVADDAFNWDSRDGVSDPMVDDVFPNGYESHPTNPMPFSMPDMRYQPRAENAGSTGNELLGLGLFETLPPTEMIEDLHQAYFTRQHPLIPIIHPGRYMQAFYSGPHLRPPMALSYAIWTTASNGHDKYSSYHDVFHRRARRYLQEDELKGDGEYFITVAHAQAWALIATDEARCMWFTRAAMSAASCVKLIHMMGIHRLDDPNAAVEMAPTIAPPRDWTELEERRRLFWGAMCIDSHASINTGWPCLINMDDVTTHLPSSEEAFSQCREEKTCRLEEVFTGSSYSSFAGAAIICHICNQILKHVHRSKPGDHPDNFEYGPYWNTHRELDNLLSSAFMFLPERFRLPENLRDPVAVHTNLNLHAAVICLHNSAYEMANEHKLPDAVKETSKARLLTASQEVVNIVKLTSHSNAGYKSPLIALSLYVASSVYITVAQDDGLEPTIKANLEFLLLAMGAIGKQHMITDSFYRQTIHDLRRGGLLGLVRVPEADMLLDIDNTMMPCGKNIPLFARSRASRQTDILPPLPGRLPLNNPIGRRFPRGQLTDVAHWNVDSRGHRDGEEDEVGNTNKRKRPNPTSLRPGDGPPLWFDRGPAEGGAPQPSAPGGGLAQNQSRSDEVFGICKATNAAQFRLPNRAGSSTGSSPSVVTAAGAEKSIATPASTQTSSGMNSGTMSTGNKPLCPMMSNEGVATDQVADAFGSMDAASQDNNALDLNLFQGLDTWDATGDPAQDVAALFSQVTGAMQDGTFVASSSENDGWMLLNEPGAGDHLWGTGQGRGGEV
ncbi:Transcriptional activator protein acu-15 [Cytospora mali]|uniref:Transcriptional activator protein acu-15 n=1 Tax=Cytospora mali TaxID=578113 RepID=A0A194VMD3_CYTMA|nr:Transcriptional activator protein acu-15 [Valsa mali]